MREILFRGKCKTDNEWLYGFPYVTRKNAVKINWYCSEFGSMRTDEVDPETIGQYTGLTDKNGVRIFEGDILTIENEGVYAAIKYNESNAAFYVEDEDHEDYLGEAWETDVIIIGNIHDNPELLGGENNGINR